MYFECVQQIIVLKTQEKHNFMKINKLKDYL